MLRNEKFAYKLGTRIQTKDLFGVKQQCYPLLHRAVGFNPLQFFFVFLLSEQCCWFISLCAVWILSLVNRFSD